MRFVLLIVNKFALFFGMQFVCQVSKDDLRFSFSGSCFSGLLSDMVVLK